jgi:adenylate kinase family enzyme
MPRSRDAKRLLLFYVVILFILLLPTFDLSLAQTPTPTPPPPTATATFLEEHEPTLVEGLVDVVGEVTKYVITGLIAILVYAFFKPRYEHWIERRKLRLEEKAKTKEEAEDAARRRQVHDERLQRYLKRVAQAYNHTRVVGQTEPMPLSDIFTELQLLDRPEAKRRFDVHGWLADPERRDDPVALFERLRERGDRRASLEFLDDPQAHRLFILGRPGAGKTTLLRYLACRAATGYLHKIPIFVTLREWADADQDLLAFIVVQFDLYDFPQAQTYVKQLLEETDDVLVLFDGLDEIPQTDDRRIAAIKALHDFARRYERAQILITCRVAASDYAFEDFNYVEVADFTDEQIRAYARKWFRDSGKKKDRFLEELEKQEHRGLRELARQPLLLGLLCLNFDETMRFPTRRVSLYNEALSALLTKWDAQRAIQRDYQMLDVDRKHQLFAHLAYGAFDQGMYFFPHAQLVQAIAAYMMRVPATDKSASDGARDGAKVLRAIEEQHGILVERAQGLHAFAHLTFQEYYTARYVVDNTLEGTLPKLLAHAHEDRWREVIVLATSMFPNADAFFEAFLARLEALVKRDDKLVAFLGWAERKAASVDVLYKPAAVRAYYAWRGRASAFDLGLELEHDLGLALELDRELVSALDPASARALDLDRARASARARARARAFASASARARARELARALELDRELARARASANARARARASANARARALASASTRARDIGDTALHTALSALVVPDEDAPAETWEAFAAQLQGIMIEYRDIGHDWDFTEAQGQTLEDYFRAVEVLVKCLDVAYVTDREAIEAQLVVAPKEG